LGITEHIDQVTLIPAGYLKADPPAPKSVKIELTGRCNYRCGFCALRTREKQPTGDMDFGLFQRITSEMYEAGVEEIGVFYLGESCSSPELLVKAITHVKQLGFPYCFLTTNGSLMTPALANDCMKAGLDSMKFSINAADEDQFKAIMGVKKSLFRDALQNLKSARSVRDLGQFKCGLYASSIRYDGEQQKKMEGLIAEHVLPFVDEHYWLGLMSIGGAAREREEQLGFKPTAGNQGRLGMLRDPLPCWAVMTEAHVTADGTLSAYCMDADGRFGMGNLNETSFMDAWHSEAFKELRAAHLRKDVTGTVCEKCILYA